MLLVISISLLNTMNISLLITTVYGVGFYLFFVKNFGLYFSPQHTRMRTIALDKAWTRQILQQVRQDAHKIGYAQSLEQVADFIIHYATLTTDE